MESRRTFLNRCLAAPAVLGASALVSGAGAQARLPATPSCGPTVSQTEGPFYTPSSPRRHALSGDGEGTRLTLVGYVLSTRCEPVPNALVDLWHADAEGRYDNTGFRFRGHQFTDASGRYGFDTIVPGEYPGRTAHFHLKVQAADGPVLTTQLYFPNLRGNARDGLFRPDLLVAMTAGSGARFDFVLDLG